jgi:hypothetical protein
MTFCRGTRRSARIAGQLNSLTLTQMMGEEKFFVHTLHASDPEAVKAGKVEYTPPVPLVNASDLWLRSERQTLRRMPRTGMILFTVRTYLTNLDTLVKEPRVPGRLLSALNGMDSKIAAYKATELFRDAVVPGACGRSLP